MVVTSMSQMCSFSGYCTITLKFHNKHIFSVAVMSYISTVFDHNLDN
uniref:Uncharacterized protein n=1 Tax=Aegilops tauschii subsp. strangulata TaxID=200361 RepID=A0A452XTS8_AEGTS